MSTLSVLKVSKIQLPQEEKDIQNLSDCTVLDKIHKWWNRCQSSEFEEVAIIEFMDLMATYPASMCAKGLTDTLKLLIALFYFYEPMGEPPGYLERLEKATREPDTELWRRIVANWDKIRFSYEQLSIIFDKSKATIFEAIKEKETDAKRLIEQAQADGLAHTIALKELVEEKKKEIKLIEENNQKNKQTDERTVPTLASEDICSAEK